MQLPCEHLGDTLRRGDSHCVVRSGDTAATIWANWAASRVPSGDTSASGMRSGCSSPSSPDTPRPQVVLPTRQFSSSRSPATPRTTLALPRRQFSASSSPATLRTRVAYQIALSSACRALDTHDLRRGLRGQPANRTLACISRTRHARSPQRVALSVDAVRPALRL